MKRKQWLYLTLGVVVIGGCVGLFRLLFEKVETEVDISSTSAARVHRWLAAERMLTALELPARGVRGPVRLPPTDYVLILLTPRSTLGVDRSQWLLDWVHEGGHLIVTPRDALRDPLLEALGLTVEIFDEGETELLEVRAAPSLALQQIEIRASSRLSPGDPTPDFETGDGVLVRYPLGEGWVTVLSDGRFLDNSRIGEHQHASFLWSLVTTPERPAGVWLVYQDQLPGLRRLLFERAWMVFLSGFLLLGAWLWRRGAAFGPRLPPATAARRSLREHLAATAEFLWRRGQAAVLVASVRQAVLHTVRRQHPAWNGLSEKERLRYLAELSGVDGTSLVEALEGSAARHPETFIRMISTLEKVRRSL